MAAERAVTIDGSRIDELRIAAGASLRTARLRARLSLQQLSRRSGGRFRPSSLGGYERGERAISLERFCELARLLGVPADQLLTDVLLRSGSPGHRTIVLDLTVLPGSHAGGVAAEHANQVRSRRGDFLSSVVTLRAGDLERIAAASGLEVAMLLSSLEPAVIRVDPA